MSTHGASSEWRPRATFETLRRRAAMVDATRRFFAARGVLEVDTPVLQGGANLDPGVTPFTLQVDRTARFLPTSPEHPLKRLVAAGRGPLWTLAPAFRRDERGARHQPEFRMLEWYRPGWGDAQLLGEVLELFDAIAAWGTAHEILSWRDAFVKHARLDPITADDAALRSAIGEAATAAHDRGELLDLLLATRVEPHLGRGTLTVINDYPAERAAQARVRRGADGRDCAARFEIYRDGVELANGYWELTDAAELGHRLDAQLAQRADASLARDPRFDAAMSAGLPACSGVAVGFDRVVMLALGLATVAETMAFPWDIA